VFLSLASRSSQGEEELVSCVQDSTLSFSRVGVQCVGLKLHILCSAFIHASFMKKAVAEIHTPGREHGPSSSPGSSII